VYSDLRDFGIAAVAYIVDHTQKSKNVEPVNLDICLV
jgi:hypothetical protein